MIKKYEDFRNNIIDTINDAGLNIGIVTYIFRDICRDIEAAYKAQLSKEIKEENTHEDTEDGSVETVEEV